jgi:hypothetical protein
MMGTGDNKTAKRDELEAMLDNLEKAERDPASLLRNGDSKSDMSKAIEMSLGMIEPKLRIEHPEKYEEYKVLPLTAKLSYVVNLYPDLAKRCDPSLVQRFDDLIGPLLEKVLDSSFARAISSQSHPSITSLGQNLSLSGTLIIRSVYETRASDKERTLLFLNHYKTAVEGLFKWQIDLTTYALVKSGLLFVRGSKQLRMQTLGQVKKEDLGHKLNFVRNHGLDLLSSACNPTLRNGIAHESYEVAGMGQLDTGTDECASIP